jgi:hypothetical protein
LLSILHTNGQPRYIIGQEGPSGAAGGTSQLAGDPNNSYLKSTLISITISSGALIDAILCSSVDEKGNSGSPFGSIGGNGGNKKVLDLLPGEFIVRITGKYGQYLEYLYIQTSGSRSQYVEFGNLNSNATGRFDYQAVDGYKIGGLVIDTDSKYITALGVVLQKREVLLNH